MEGRVDEIAALTNLISVEHQFPASTSLTSVGNVAGEAKVFTMFSSSFASQSARLYPGCIPGAMRWKVGLCLCIWPNCEAPVNRAFLVMPDQGLRLDPPGRTMACLNEGLGLCLQHTASSSLCILLGTNLRIPLGANFVNMRAHRLNLRGLVVFG